jgi:hypothetical protein
MAIALIAVLLLAVCLLAPLLGVDSGAWDRKRRSGWPGSR